MYGDVNGDGKVNPIDDMILARYLAKWQGYDAMVDLSAADTNSDGNITPIDDMILARHLAKWNGYEILPYKN